MAGKGVAEPHHPNPYPGRAALCLSRKMVLESLWGREGKPHHLPLNVNYAFMNVFIGSDAPRPPPLCEPRGVGLSVAWAWGWAGRACRMSTLSEEVLTPARGGVLNASGRAGCCVRTGRDHLHSEGDDRVPSDT